MNYFIECWNAKDTWKVLSNEEKQAYVENVKAATASMLEKGVECLTWSENIAQGEHKAAYDYFAIWRIPSESLTQELLALIEGAGWYNYFEQVNALGKEDSATSVLAQIIQKNNIHENA